MLHKIEFDNCINKNAILYKLSENIIYLVS